MKNRKNIRSWKLMQEAIQIKFFKYLGLDSNLQPLAFSFERQASSLQLPASVVIVFFSLFTFHSLSAQQLQSYIQTAEENNPEIQAFNLRYEIAEEKINEVNSYPDTEFGVGYFVSEPETRTGAQKERLSIRQMIPWFGSITARENYASSMADAEYVEVAIAKRKLTLSVAQSYYQLYANSAKQKVLQENIELLETFHELALNSLEVGSASAVDVLRLQMRQNDLAQQKVSLEQEFNAQQVLFNNLLNREQNLSVEVYDSLFIPQEEAVERERIAEVHPELLKFDRLYESVAEAEKLNQKEAAPKLGFGLDYINVQERTDMSLADNGKDILMPMVSVFIPIFNNKYKSVTRQNELRQKELEAQKSQRFNVLQTKLEEALSGRTSAKVTAYTFLRNLEQADDAEEILIKSYETGTIDFDDVLEVQELQLKFQTGLIEAVKNYYMQSAVINYLSN
ncbi:TolC family protein [Gramella sp. AN32]|uniref:TolC family protein n=1 Tax=Christiangramia antarctica TaxID=2058158 RepID=A0ABW5X436_9FLAO|nr:TolC family protein [Gramella sp. AN32]